MLTAVKREEAAPTAANSDTEITTIYSHQSTVPVPLPVSLKRVLVQQFTAEELRHLAWLKDAGSSGLIARRNLSAASLEELAALLTDGKIPSAGWWRRAS